MKNKKSLLITLAVLGLFTVLVTGSFKNVFVSQQRNGIEPMVDLGQKKLMVEDEEMEVARGGVAAPAEMGLVVSDSVGTSRKTLPPVMPPIGGGDALDVEDRVYEKSSYHQVVVNDVSDYMRQIKEYILSVDGRVLTSNMSTSDKYHYGYITAKVPVEKFEEAAGRVTDKVDKIVSENVNAQDRTGQMVSSTTNLEKLEDQKLEKEIELTEAKTEAAKARIKLEISRLERQIETAKKKVSKVEAKIEYASVQVVAADSEKYFNPRMVTEPDLWEEIQDAWKSVSRVLVVVAKLAIWMVVYGVVWLPVVLLVQWVKGRKK